MIFFLVVILLFLISFHLVSRFNRKGRLLRKIPGPYAWPIIGNSHLFITSCMHEFWKRGHYCLKKWYPITRFWCFHTAILNVYHPDDLEILLSSNKVIEKGYAYWLLDRWLKEGLLTSGEDKWRHRRKILTPAFHFSILKKYMDIMSEHSEKLVASLKENGNEIVKSLIQFCSHYTLMIIGESTMGVPLDEMEEVNEYKEAIHEIGYTIFWRAGRPYINNFIFYILKVGKRQIKALKVLHKFSNKLIQNRRDYHEATNYKYLQEYTDQQEETVYSDYDFGRKKRMAMLDLLLLAEKNKLIDHSGVQEEVDTFTFEGHDTAGMALTYALLLLAENKECQNRARAEVTTILDKTNGKIGYTEIQEFNYLERCIKESLRLFPPVATMMRWTEDELQLKNALLPKDTHIIIHLWQTHRDPNFWVNPDKYDPDRFLPENSKNRHPFAYLPFSAGPRNCIGQKFAMMELKTIMGQILYDFYLEPIDRSADIKVIADLVLRPLDPIHLKFVKINK